MNYNYYTDSSIMETKNPYGQVRLKKRIKLIKKKKFNIYYITPAVMYEIILSTILSSIYTSNPYV